jgi:4'-phosphopantetheinyl transferase
VDVWTLPLDVDRDDVLDDDEIDRSRRFRRDADRRRFLARRAGLRLVLGAYLGIDPCDVTIDRSCRYCGDAAHGRPRLPSDSGLSFSTSSRPGLGVVAVATMSMSVGVDIEKADDVGLDAVRHTALTRGEQLTIDNARHDSAARLWCRKEALLKATGVGLGGRSPSALDVRSPVVDGWHLTDLSPADGWVGALATARAVHSVLAHQWP